MLHSLRKDLGGHGCDTTTRDVDNALLELDTGAYRIPQHPLPFKRTLSAVIFDTQNLKVVDTVVSSQTHRKDVVDITVGASTRTHFCETPCMHYSEL